MIAGISYGLGKHLITVTDPIPFAKVMLFQIATVPTELKRSAGSERECNLLHRILGPHQSVDTFTISTNIPPTKVSCNSLVCRRVYCRIHYRQCLLRHFLVFSNQGRVEPFYRSQVHQYGGHCPCRGNLDNSDRLDHPRSTPSIGLEVAFASVAEASIDWRVPDRSFVSTHYCFSNARSHSAHTMSPQRHRD